MAAPSSAWANGPPSSLRTDGLARPPYLTRNGHDLPASFATAAKPISNYFFRPLKLAARLNSFKEGCPAVSFSETEVQEGRQRLKFSLVAKFSGGRPRIDEVRREFAAAWALSGEVSIGAWDARHVLIILKSEEDSRRVLAHHLRKVGQYFFRLFRWSEDFHCKKESTVTTTWVRLLALPPQLYDQAVMESLVSTFGRFIAIDERTKAFTNPSFARVCVELDLVKAVPGKIWIGLGGEKGFWLFMEFESKLFYCIQCKIHGHQLSGCRKVITNSSSGGAPPARVVQSGETPVMEANFGQESRKGSNLNSKSDFTEVINGREVHGSKEDTQNAVDEGWKVQKRKKRVKRKNGQGNKVANDPVAAISPENESPQINHTEEVQNNVSLEPQTKNEEGTTGKELVIFHQNEIDEEMFVPQNPLRPTREVEAQPVGSDVGESPMELESGFAQKIASYGNHIFGHNMNGAPLDARGFFLALKDQSGADDAYIFEGMDGMYNEATQALNEGSNSPVEASDGSVDLSRILKNPRPRRSVRSRPSKVEPKPDNS